MIQGSYGSVKRTNHFILSLWITHICIKYSFRVIELCELYAEMFSKPLTLKQDWPQTPAKFPLISVGTLFSDSFQACII